MVNCKLAHHCTSNITQHERQQSTHATCAMVYNVHVWNYFLSMLRENFSGTNTVWKINFMWHYKETQRNWRSKTVGSTLSRCHEPTAQLEPRKRTWNNTRVQPKKFIKPKWTTSDKEQSNSFAEKSEQTLHNGTYNTANRFTVSS